MTTFKQKPDALIAMKLKPEDRDRIGRIAAQEQRSMSALCRLFVLKSVAEYEQSTTATPPAAA